MQQDPENRTSYNAFKLYFYSSVFVGRAFYFREEEDECYPSIHHTLKYLEHFSFKSSSLPTNLASTPPWRARVFQYYQVGTSPSRAQVFQYYQVSTSPSRVQVFPHHQVSTSPSRVPVGIHA